MIKDPSPVPKPRYLKSPTEFTLISNDDGTIEDYANDKVRKVGGTFSTWVDKYTNEYFLYIRPTLLSEDKPNRVTIFAELSPNDNPDLT